MFTLHSNFKISCYDIFYLIWFKGARDCIDAFTDLYVCNSESGHYYMEWVKIHLSDSMEAYIDEGKNLEFDPIVTGN